MTLTSNRLKKLLVFLLSILAVDVVTKYCVHTYVPQTLWSLPMYPYGGIPVFQNFYGIDLVISHVTNRGGPWGVVASHHTSLLFLRVFAICCLAIHLLFFNRVKFREIPLCMVIAGAMGNVLDSFFYGHVIDMIHCIFWGYSFPVFNMADASISVGVAVMLVQACVQKWKESRPRPQPIEPQHAALHNSPFQHEFPQAESFSLDKIDHHGP